MLHKTLPAAGRLTELTGFMSISIALVGRILFLKFLKIIVLVSTYLVTFKRAKKGEVLIHNTLFLIVNSNRDGKI